MLNWFEAFRVYHQQIELPDTFAAGTSAPVSDQKLRVVQVGLRYSPNLGDGAISDCVAYGLQQKLPNAQVSFLDMSGRQQYGDQIIQNRSLAIKVLSFLPRTVGQQLVSLKLKKVLDGLEPEWRSDLEADCIVLGGGQIFSDKLLNFPIKVARIVKILEERNMPVAVFAAGVSKNWSARGKKLFQGIKRLEPRMIGLRDAGSIDNWRRQYGVSPEPTHTVDPAFLAASCYGPALDSQNAVGLCVTDFGVLQHHSDGSVAGSASDPVEFYISCTKALVDKGRQVVLFTNGEGADEALLARVNSALSRSAIAADRYRIEPRAERPEALGRALGSYECVVGHRLHSHIIGYSYKCPLVGLGWDNKMESFFDLIDAKDYFSGAPDLSGYAVAGMVERAIANGVDEDQHAKVQNMAWTAFDQLARVSVKAASQA